MTTSPVAWSPLARLPRWRWAWLLVFVPAAINALTGPYLVFSGLEGGIFEQAVAGDYESFEAEQPGVIELVDRTERLTGILLTGFGLLAAAMAWVHHRRAEPSTWWSLWAVPAGFGAIAVLFAIDGDSLTGYYAAIAAASAFGVLLSPPEARPEGPAGHPVAGASSNS